MIKPLLFLTLSLVACGLDAQQLVNLNTIQPQGEYTNILVEKINTDSLSSTFVIWIKNEVRPHYHAFHEEKIYVLSGEGSMTVSGEIYHLKPGIFLNIPKGAIHSVMVEGDAPLEVISTQTPEFLGSDRIFADSENDY